MYFNFYRKGLMFGIYFFLFVCLGILYIGVRGLIKDSDSVFIFLIIIETIFVVILIWMLTYGPFSHKFYINEEGVKLIKRKESFSMKWEDIEFIGLESKSFLNKQSLFFFDSRPLIDNSYTGPNLTFNEFSDDYFCVQYRKKSSPYKCVNSSVTFI
jgi:hypothetical protein